MDQQDLKYKKMRNEMRQLRREIIDMKAELDEMKVEQSVTNVRLEKLEKKKKHWYKKID